MHAPPLVAVVVGVTVGCAVVVCVGVVAVVFVGKEERSEELGMDAVLFVVEGKTVASLPYGLAGMVVFAGKKLED